MKYISPSTLEQLKKAVETADRKLIALHRQNRDGSVKTNTFDMSDFTPERLDAYLFERNARACGIAYATGRDIYPQRTLDDYRRIAEETDRRESDLIARANTNGGYLDQINRMDRRLMEIYIGIRSASEPRPALRTEAACLLGQRNTLAMKHDIQLRSLEYYKTEAERIRTAEQETRRKRQVQKNLEAVSDMRIKM